MNAPALAETKPLPAAGRGRDYVTLGKPGIGIMVSVTAASGAILASGGPIFSWTMFHAALGTGLLSAGAAALNHYFERDVDARMARTAKRPLPSGRVPASHALWFGVVLGCLGAVHLATFTTPAAAALGVISLLLYVGVYTPLKTVTTWNTVVGAFPGAIPILIGWSATGARFDAAALALFAWLFLWQFPHFFAIAWIYRDDYAAAGIRMFPSTPVGRRYAALQATSITALTVAVSLSPPLVALGGTTYAILAAACGAYFLAYAIAFLREQTPTRARMLMFSSLIYLPSVLGFLVLSAVAKS